ncbi:MAG: microcystin degradation protein MlrC [Betaproteobacteria bacterium]|nr:microcystin degradation protein MlrC [Betaproteobacteria bacterium]
MARIAVGGFHHETNCFVPVYTDFNYFATVSDRPPLSRGEEVLRNLPNRAFGMSGFIADMADQHELVPLVWASGGAGGYVTSDAFERIVGELVGRLSVAMPVDAVYLDLHGAMCSVDFEDGEGEILRRVRATVGPDIPVVISLDYHTNLTPAMAALTDGMAIYYTYPHVDRPQTGSRAARIVNTVLNRGRPTARAFRKLPFLIPLNFQCTLVEPSKGIVAKSAAGEGGDVTDLCYGAGFPPSDLSDCGPGIIAHGYSKAAVDAAADELEKYVIGMEKAFAQPLLTPDAAVREAMAISDKSKRPVVIADTQDNPGCGGTGDTTGMLEALVRNRAEQAAICVLTDPKAAAAAHAAGEGAEITIDLGGCTPLPDVKPFRGTFRVTRLSDGRFVCKGPCVGGREAKLGPTALLTIDGVSIVVASKRMQAYDLEIFRHIGVEPTAQKILVVKSTCHFRADFEPIAEQVLVAVAPGAHLVDARLYPYKNLRAGVRLEPLGPAFKPVASSTAR